MVKAARVVMAEERVQPGHGVQRGALGVGAQEQPTCPGLRRRLRRLRKPPNRIAHSLNRRPGVVGGSPTSVVRTKESQQFGLRGRTVVNVESDDGCLFGNRENLACRSDDSTRRLVADARDRREPGCIGEGDRADGGEAGALDRLQPKALCRLLQTGYRHCVHLLDRSRPADFGCLRPCCK
ncbi:MAG: hypothetical protein WAS51_08925 [Ilumatobacteraceae bacterium]